MTLSPYRLAQPKLLFKLLILLALVLCGWLQATTLASPLSGKSIGSLQIFALASAILLLTWQPNLRSRVLAGWLFATAWLASTFWWLFISLYVYGELNPLLAILGVLVLAAALALYYLLAIYLFFRFSPQNWLLQALLFASLWTLAELARGCFLTGFPWGAIGYSHLDNSPLTAFAPWLGVYGISWLAAFLAACLANLVRLYLSPQPEITLAIIKRPTIMALLSILVAGGVVKLINHWLFNQPEQLTKPISVTLLQGNIPSETKFDLAGINNSLQWYKQHSKDVTSDLLIMPETAIPVGQDLLPLAFFDKYGAQAKENNQAIFVGLPFYNPNTRYSNSILAFSAQQSSFARAYRYDKQHLVPFGEFVPDMLRWFTNMLNIPYDDLIALPEYAQTSFSWQTINYAFTICFEDLFGEELAQFYNQPSKIPEVFINTSNIGWFGNSSIIPQHLNISRMRSIEFRRPMLRAANSGPTAIIDLDGQVLSKLPYYQEGSLTGIVQGSKLITPYAYWVARFNLYPLWLLLGLLSGWIIWRAKKLAA